MTEQTPPLYIKSPDLSEIIPTEISFVDLVLQVLTEEQGVPFAIYQVSSLDPDGLYGIDSGTTLVATYKNAPGGYGSHTIALSRPDENGVIVITKPNEDPKSLIQIRRNANQSPLYDHRDSIHYVAPTKYYTLDAGATINELLDYLQSQGAQYSETTELLLPPRNN